jgi:hypothetical protein
MVAGTPHADDMQIKMAKQTANLTLITTALHSAVSAGKLAPCALAITVKAWAVLVAKAPPAGSRNRDRHDARRFRGFCPIARASLP